MRTVMEADLKPCPFCGGKAELVDDRRIGSGGYFVGCNTYQCNMCMGGLFYSTPEEAIEHWNVRAGDGV